MHRRCCWPPESARAEVWSRSRTSSQRRRLQAVLDPAAHVVARRGHAVDPEAVGDVLEDGFRKRVRLLEDHADPPAQGDDVDAGRVDIVVVDQDRTLDPGPGNDVVHPIERPRNVDFPHPDGQMRAVTWFASIFSSMFSRTRSSPKKKLARHVDFDGRGEPVGPETVPGLDAARRERRAASL